MPGNTDKHAPVLSILCCARRTHVPRCSLVLSRTGTMLRVFYFVFACVKGPFCVRKLPFLLTTYFFTRDAKDPFYIRKMRVNACFYSPPLYTQTQTHIPGPMHAMRAKKHGGNCWDLSLHCSNHSIT